MQQPECATARWSSEVNNPLGLGVCLADSRASRPRHTPAGSDSVAHRGTPPLRSHRRKVLWIDDDLTAGNASVRLLVSEGFDVECACSGATGLARAQVDPYDAIILDLRLPDAPGTTVLERLVAEGVSAPVLVLTGYPDVGSAVATMKLGAVDYKRKPLIGDELIAAVQAAVEASVSAGPRRASCEPREPPPRAAPPSEGEAAVSAPVAPSGEWGVPVFIIEANSLAASFLVSAVGPGHQLRVIREAETLLAENTPLSAGAVVVVDIDTLGLPSFPYMAALMRTEPRCKFVVLTHAASLDVKCKLACQGVHGIVTYDRVGELRAAVTAVAVGKLWLAPDLLHDAAAYLSRIAKGALDGLRPRLTVSEMRVLALIERNLSNKQIAEALGISERTVRFHLANLFAKFGVNDRHSLAECARDFDALGRHSRE